MPPSRPPVPASSVITSYSIHYTKLYDPAEWLLARFRLSGKILVIGAGFLAVIALLMGLFLQQQSEAIDFSARERVGVQVIVPLVDAIKAVQTHRVERVKLLAGDSGA